MFTISDTYCISQSCHARCSNKEQGSFDDPPVAHDADRHEKERTSKQVSECNGWILQITEIERGGESLKMQRLLEREVKQGIIVHETNHGFEAGKSIVAVFPSSLCCDITGCRQVRVTVVVTSAQKLSVWQSEHPERRYTKSNKRFGSGARKMHPLYVRFPLRFQFMDGDFEVKRTLLRKNRRKSQIATIFLFSKLNLSVIAIGVGQI